MSKVPAAPKGDIKTYARAPFEYDGVRHDVYRKGTGPAVIVMSEVPGISPQLLGFADRLVALGCSVAVPRMFGPIADMTALSAPGRALTYLRGFSEVCISREFNVLASGRSSPVTHWLRGLCAHEHERCGGPGVGVVGMCFTGGFALALASDPRVLAPVVAEPSLPGAGNPGGIDCDKLTLATVAQRCAREGLEVLGLRFKGDSLSPYQRFQTLRDKLGDGFVAVEIDPQFGHPDSPIPHPHSVLTLDFVDTPGHPTHDALERVLDLFRRKLLS
ncbi:MAG TPA: dienelactone hydrolase family protein [Polyangiales bacterium]